MNGWRHEYKYICDSISLQLIEKKIQTVMGIDAFAQRTGMYNVRSLYFDDYMGNCFLDNENGNDPRSKWRIRIYNYSDNRISLEKKIKNKGMTKKQSCLIDKDLYYAIIYSKCINYMLGKNPLLDEFIIQRNEKNLHPVMMGEYIRKPYVYDLGNVRVTLDCNISACNQYKRIFDKDILKIPILKSGYHVLEVKWDDYLPDTIYELICNYHLVNTNFSKFYLGCKALEGRTL